MHVVIFMLFSCSYFWFHMRQINRTFGVKNWVKYKKKLLGFFCITYGWTWYPSHSENITRTRLLVWIFNRAFKTGSEWRKGTKYFPQPFPGNSCHFKINIRKLIFWTKYFLQPFPGNSRYSLRFRIPLPHPLRSRPGHKVQFLSWMLNLIL